jgi:succinoglycan biosynthesis protein ExoV
MELYYYNEKSNVGDALNPFIFNYLLFKYFNGDHAYKNINFYGIGTLIFQHAIDLKENNVFFGTGLRDVMFGDKIKPEHNSDFRFVRGPLSSKLLGGKTYITDPAYLVKEHPLFEEIIQYTRDRKRKVIGIIPYYIHEDFFKSFRLPNYEISIINPSKSPEEFLKQLSLCSYVITGAMHGAILADLLRIPWCRLKLNPNSSESSFLSDFKWHDWSLSLEISNIPTIDIGYQISISQSFRSKLKNIYIQRVLSEAIVNTIKGQSLILSNESILNNKIDQLKDALEAFKRDYPIDNNTLYK